MKSTAESRIEAGKVNTQAAARFRIVLHCRPEPFAAIVPATPEVSTWVVLTGKWSAVADWISVIATSSSDDKLARGKALGADHLINYKTKPDWETEVLALTANRGVDYIVEVGGPGTLPRSFKAAAPGAHIYLIGVLTGRGEGVDVMPVLQKSLHLDGVYVGSRAMIQRMNAAFSANTIKPVIDQVLPLAEYRAAFEYMDRGSHFGKIVLSLT